MSEDSYSDIGGLLGRARREFSLSVEDVGRLLHIRTRYIEAMEEGRFSDLPGVIYTKGYLQSYATFLGLDKDEILRRFEEVEKTMSKRGLYFPGVLSREKTPSQLIIWGAAGAAVLLYFAWLFVMRPPMSHISLVEAFPPEPLPGMEISAEMMGNVSCLQPQIRYYPPCTALSQDFYLLPLLDRLPTIMALAPHGEDSHGDTNNNDSDDDE